MTVSAEQAARSRDVGNAIQRTVAAFLAEKMPVKGHGHDQAQ